MSAATFRAASAAEMTNAATGNPTDNSPAIRSDPDPDIGRSQARYIGWAVIRLREALLCTRMLSTRMGNDRLRRTKGRDREALQRD